MSNRSFSIFKRPYLVLLCIVAASGFSIWCAQRRQIDTRPGPQALLTAAADVQHEMTRVPSKLVPLTDEDEIALGNALASRFSSTANTADNNAVPVYLQEVGSRVAAHARRKLLWRFHYIPSPNYVNAFALPRGHVFVGEGLLRLMQSEDALAAVLGHEVEHTDLRHCAEWAQAEAQLQQLGPIADLAGLPAKTFMAGYSKEQELEADRDGTAMAVQAGYSYEGIVQLFGTFSHLEQEQRQQSSHPGNPVSEAARLSSATLVDYFASHPPSSQRSEQIIALAAQRGWPKHPPRCLRNKLNSSHCLN